MPIETGINRLLDFEVKTNKGIANGYCGLDASALIAAANIPDLYLKYTGGTMTGNIVQLGNIGAVRSQSTNAIVTATDFILNLAPIASFLSCTFPATSGFAIGQKFIVRRNLSTVAGNIILILSAAGEKFNGKDYYYLKSPFQTVGIVNVGGAWVISFESIIQQDDTSYTQDPTMFDNLIMIGDPSKAIYFNQHVGANKGFIYYNSTAGAFILNGYPNLTLQDASISKTLTDLNKFIGRSDVPANYTGAGSKLVAVNTGETALEFIANTINSATLGPWEETNKGLVTDWTAGTDIYHSHDAEFYNMIGTTYTTLKTITLDFVPNSTLRIYYEYKATYQSKWNIFRNGVAVGTEKTYNGAYTNWTENIAGWADGDILTIKGKCDAGINCPTNIYCQNLRILCTANKIRNS